MWDLFVAISVRDTQTQQPPTVLALFFPLQFIINGGLAAAKLIHCTQSEGRPGQVSQVALQSAIYLSLPKVSECMADESNL